MFKWSEALFYSGRKDEARKQFAAAAGLDLSVAEKAELRGCRMAEDDEIVSSRATGDAAAGGIAMSADAAMAEPARAYLHEQTELAKLQKQNLLEQNAFELSHLRWRRFNVR